MLLSDIGILKGIEEGQIVIEPFRRECLGSNSYDVHLSKYLAVYDMSKVSYDKTYGGYIDAKKHNEVVHREIPEEGIILVPGVLYLGNTLEYTESHAHVPFLEGKSSTGRLGIDIHATAGKGDIGFCNHWTLEISVQIPVKVYAGMPIGQLIYFEVNESANPYNKKVGAKYTQRNVRPVESMMFKNQF